MQAVLRGRCPRLGPRRLDILASGWVEERVVVVVVEELQLAIVAGHDDVIGRAGAPGEARIALERLDPRIRCGIEVAGVRGAGRPPSPPPPQHPAATAAPALDSTA